MIPRYSLSRQLLQVSLAGSMMACLLPGCGSGGGGGPVNPISGVINAASFNIPAGATRTATDDLVVNSTGDLVIDGTLLMTPGARVALYSDTNVLIHGPIHAAPTRSEGRAGRAGEPPADLVIAGHNVDINTSSAPFTIEVADAGGSALITTTGTGGRVTIAQEIITKPGNVARNRSEVGGDGGNIEIGTDRTIAAAAADGRADASRPASIAVSASLTSGAGGDGYSDGTGVMVGVILDFHGTDGGRGGDILLQGTNVTAPSQFLKAGAGEKGGEAHRVARAPDGAQPGQAGTSVTAVSGSGGRGGTVRVGDQEISRASGGKAGDVIVAAGNGGPGGDGGWTTVRVGAPGDDTLKNRATCLFQYGGNGGTSTSPDRNGGAGGNLVITVAHRPDDSTGLSPDISAGHYGLGGNGFDGCSVSPVTFGTHGGKGGIYDSIVPMNFPTTVFEGGNAGDGAPPGVRGKGGSATQQGTAFPDGKPGVTCDIAEVSVKLAVDLKSGGVVKFTAGTVIPFRNFEGAHIADPDIGCNKKHPHAPFGFKIDGIGPFDDPNPGGCGIGEFVSNRKATVRQ